MPEADEATKKVASELMTKNEQRLLQEGITDLFPQVREILSQLHAQGIALFVASNGQEAYIDAICEYFSIKHLFTDLYSAGRFGTKSKIELVAKLLQDYGIENGVMVGDRHSDIEAGKTNGLFTIGCDFGFAGPGELDQADQIVNQFDQIMDVIPFPIRKAKK